MLETNEFDRAVVSQFGAFLANSLACLMFIVCTLTSLFDVRM